MATTTNAKPTPRYVSCHYLTTHKQTQNNCIPRQPLTSTSILHFLKRMSIGLLHLLLLYQMQSGSLSILVCFLYVFNHMLCLLCRYHCCSLGLFAAFILVQDAPLLLFLFVLFRTILSYFFFLLSQESLILFLYFSSITRYLLIINIFIHILL